MLLSASEFVALTEGFKLLHGGLEHQVFWKRKNGRLFKITKPPHFGASWYLKDYVENVLRCNAVFGDDIRLNGVVDTHDGVSLVMSQPYIIGKSPSEDQIKEWFGMQGCTHISLLKWRYPNGRIVGDAHTGNLILTRDGSLFPVDLHVEKLGDGDALLLELLTVEP